VGKNIGVEQKALSNKWLSNKRRGPFLVVHSFDRKCPTEISFPLEWRWECKQVRPAASQ